MLTNEQIEAMKEEGYTFEEIESVKLGLKNIAEWKTISEEEFWSRIYKRINDKMKQNA